MFQECSFVVKSAHPFLSIADQDTARKAHDKCPYARPWMKRLVGIQLDYTRHAHNGRCLPLLLSISLLSYSRPDGNDTFCVDTSCRCIYACSVSFISDMLSLPGPQPAVASTRLWLTVWHIVGVSTKDGDIPKVPDTI